MEITVLEMRKLVCSGKTLAKVSKFTHENSFLSNIKTDDFQDTISFVTHGSREIAYYKLGIIWYLLL